MLFGLACDPCAWNKKPLCSFGSSLSSTVIQTLFCMPNCQRLTNTFNLYVVDSTTRLCYLQMYYCGLPVCIMNWVSTWFCYSFGVAESYGKKNEVIGLHLGRRSRQSWFVCITLFLVWSTFWRNFLNIIHDDISKRKIWKYSVVFAFHTIYCSFDNLIVHHLLFAIKK
jgi:hypothetical protein